MQQFTFKEMLDAINASSQKRWKDSKLRYYLLDVLDERVGKPGREATYSSLTLGKLMFLCKVLESPMQPTIKQALLMMERLSNEELRRIGEGEEEIEYGIPDVDESGKAVYRTLSGRTAPQEDHPFGRVMNLSATSPLFENAMYQKKTLDLDRKHGAADYVASEFERYLGRDDQSPVKRDTNWQTFRFGPDLQIRYRKPLTQSQEKRLRLAGELLHSILGEEEKNDG
jgi:hypothetical protein